MLMLLWTGYALAETPEAVLMHNGADRFQKAMLRPDGSALMVGAEPEDHTADGLALPTQAWALRMEPETYRERWLRVYGGSGDDALWDATPLPESGWIVVGEAASPDGGVIGWHEGYYDTFQNKGDGWLARLDEAGNMVWNLCLGGSQWDWFSAVCPRGDGTFLAVGSTSSPDGDLDGLYADPTGNEHSDAWIVCFTAEGEVLWQRVFGHPTMSESLADIQPMENGGFLLAGKARVEDWAEQGWLVAIDPDGEILWERTLGGQYGEGLSALCRTPDGGFLAVGYTESEDEFVPELTRYTLCSGWVLRLTPQGALMWQARIVVGEHCALSEVVYDHDGFMVAGESIWPDSPGEEGWALSLDAQGLPRWSNNVELDEVTVTLLQGQP